MTIETMKQRVGTAVAEQIESGMCLGLGTGSTSEAFLDALTVRIDQGEVKGLVGYATSERTAAKASAMGIALCDWRDAKAIDLAVDGADEVDRDFHLTKGWGGALVREKFVEKQANKLWILIDPTKVVTHLGTRGPIPLEVHPSQAAQACERLKHELASVFERLHVRKQDGVGTTNTAGKDYITDNGNVIIDAYCASPIKDPEGLAEILERYDWLAGHGLFINMAKKVWLADADGVHSFDRKNLAEWQSYSLALTTTRN